MMNLSIIPLDNQKEWHGALEGIPHGFAHTWGYNHAMSLAGGVRSALYCCEIGNVRIVCPLAEREFRGCRDLVKPYGFNGFVGNRPCEEFPVEWRRLATERGYVCGYLGIHPFLTDQTYYRCDEAQAYNSVFVLDLKQSEQELVNRASKGRKAQIKKVQRGECELITDKETLREFLVGNYSDFILSRGASKAYEFSKLTMECLTSLDNVFLVGKSGDNGIEVAAVFAYTPWGGEYLFNVSKGHGKGYSAEVVWQGVKTLKARGVPRLNLGGGIAPTDGIAEFKRRFGPEVVELKSVKQVYDQEGYYRLCQQVGADVNSSGFFPAYRGGELATKVETEEN